MRISAGDICNVSAMSVSSIRTGPSEMATGIQEPLRRLARLLPRSADWRAHPWSLAGFDLAQGFHRGFPHRIVR